MHRRNRTFEWIPLPGHHRRRPIGLSRRYDRLRLPKQDSRREPRRQPEPTSRGPLECDAIRCATPAPTTRRTLLPASRQSTTRPAESNRPLAPEVDSAALAAPCDETGFQVMLATCEQLDVSVPSRATVETRELAKKSASQKMTCEPGA